MHVRVSTTKRNGKTYRYAQLVQSYRRDDGVPAHRIVGNLGALPEQTIANLRAALEASRRSKAIVVADESEGLSGPSQVKANLRYLDLAVMLQLWRQWGLDALIADLMPPTAGAAEPAAVVATLVLQRCVAPGSKLYAQRWFPTTALPELLNVTTERFNNTRLHRVLDSLHTATPVLQERLPQLYQEHSGPFASFFMDLTDTYFEGRGCEVAETHPTKAGIKNKKSIGIVLMVSQLGLPLRWGVVSSKTPDQAAMSSMVDRVKTLAWAQKTPMVFDRAMGRKATVRHLVGSKLRFLTVAPVNMIDTYTNQVPHDFFSDLPIRGTDASRKDDIRVAAEAARAAGLREVTETKYVRDLGVVECDLSDDATPSKRLLKRRTTRRKPADFDRRDLASWIRLARDLQAKLDSGRFMHRRALAEAQGLSVDEVRRILDMQRLAPAIQEQILASTQELYLPWRRMRRVLEEANHVRQQEMLADVLGTIDAPNTSHQSSLTKSKADEDDRLRDSGQFSATSCQIRLVIYFNPELFVRQRLNGHKRIGKLRSFIKKLNEELNSTSRSRKEEPVRRRIMRELEKSDSVSLFDVSVVPIDVTSKSGEQLSSFRCELKLRDDKWRFRHRYDGFILLVGHADLGMSGEELVRLYYAKDLIEKDFQSIKSVLKLRPIYSYTDAKVEAHVTVCMLSVALQRILEHRLRNAAPPLSLSAPACREILSTCHLNYMKRSAAGRSFYSVTEATQAQREVLHALEMLDLVEDQAVAQVLAPRVE